jgi:hypothetical protein
LGAVCGLNSNGPGEDAYALSATSSASADPLSANSDLWFRSASKRRAAWVLRTGTRYKKSSQWNSTL